MPEILSKVLRLWLGWNCCFFLAWPEPCFHYSALRPAGGDLFRALWNLAHLVQPNSQPGTCRGPPCRLLGPPPLYSSLSPGTLPWRISATHNPAELNYHCFWAPSSCSTTGEYFQEGRLDNCGVIVALDSCILSLKDLKFYTLLLIIQYVKTVSSNILSSFMVIFNGSQV